MWRAARLCYCLPMLYVTDNKLSSANLIACDWFVGLRGQIIAVVCPFSEC
jgi:hypothetical protein